MTNQLNTISNKSTQHLHAPAQPENVPLTRKNLAMKELEQQAGDQLAIQNAFAAVYNERSLLERRKVADDFITPNMRSNLRSKRIVQLAGIASGRSSMVRKSNEILLFGKQADSLN